jgi:hypothetical protein
VPDYTATYLPGGLFPSLAAGPITGGDPLEVAAAGQVQKCATGNSPKFVGMAAHDSAAGQRISVIAAHAVHDGPADGPIAAGDLLGASAVAGRAVRTIAAAGVLGNQDVGAAPTQTTINTAVNAVVAAVNAGGARRIGLALTGAADGATVRWMQL